MEMGRGAWCILGTTGSVVVIKLEVRTETDSRHGVCKSKVESFASHLAEAVRQKSLAQHLACLISKGLALQV